MLNNIWDFFQNEVLGMKWLSRLIGSGLTAAGLDTSGRVGGSIQFFIYDTIKIMILLGFLILMISYIQSYFPPERTRKILGRFQGIWANIIAALLGTVLNMKPILVIHGGKLDAYAKIRGMKAARRTMLAAIHKEIEENYQEELKNGELGIQMAYSSMDQELVADWEKQIREEFPDLPLLPGRLSLSLSCHIGPGGLGIAVTKQINKD